MRGHQQHPEDRDGKPEDARRWPAAPAKAQTTAQTAAQATTQITAAQTAARIAATGAGSGLTAGLVMALQRTVGNDAVTRMLQQQRHTHSASCGHQAPGPRDTPGSAVVQRSSVHQVLRSPGRPLDEPVRQEMETRLGADFSDVRVHDDATARRSAAEVGARAYTSGEHVVIGQGGGDKHTLAHELTHVIQQRSGAVAGTQTPDGLQISDPSDRFERAAEANATRVMQGPVDLRRTAADRHRPAPAGEVVQRVLTPPQVAQGTPLTPDFRSRSDPAQGHRVVSAWMVSNGTRPLGSPPSGNPPGYDYIRQLKLTNFWIRFHLVNEKAGGPGDSRNLVPSSKRDNSRYETTVEQPLKTDVQNAKNKPGDGVFFGVEVNYGTAATGTQRQQDNAPYFPTSLDLYHMYFDAGTGQWAARQNHGAQFTFLDRQPADPGGSMAITALTLPLLQTNAPAYTNWNNDDVRFLQSLGNARKSDFERLINDASGLGATQSVEHAFNEIRYQAGNPSTRPPRNAAPQGTTPFAHRINNANAIQQLSAQIAQGRITL